MNDLVERLRSWQKHYAPANSIDIDILTREAAAEIERLRDETQELRRLLVLVDGPARLQEIERLRHPKIIVGSRKLWEAMGEIVSEAETERLTDIVERLRDIALIPDPITTAREAADEIERLREVLGQIKWKSIDKDNMEFQATITYVQMDAIRALKEKADD